MSVDFDQNAGAPCRNLHRIVASQVFVRVDGGIAGDDAAAVELFRYVPTDKTGIFIRITVFRARQIRNSGRGMMRNTDDDVISFAILYNQERLFSRFEH
jgi:hypothetical protein